MPNIPRRGLGSVGILRDPAPYDLDPAAWSGGANVLFDGKAAIRAPVFRTAASGFSSVVPAGLAARRPASGYDMLFILGTDGTIMSLVSGVMSNVTPVTWTSAVTDDQWTSTYLGDVTYVNRPSHVPWGYGSSSSDFEEMPSWDTTWRCGSLRAYKDYLVALNVTKGATNFPQMVKTSDATLAGLFPASWDHTDPATNATENILADLTSPLVDGAVLGDQFILYSKSQVWTMQAVPTSDVFQYRKLFTEGGVIAPNCVVEVGGRHYVFGVDDIYRHGGSGVDKESIVELKNRNHIFRTLDLTKSKRCFVLHIPSMRSILFAYPTNDAAPFTAVNGCNRAFVYNYAADTHSFIDLPDATASTLANLDVVPLWSGLGMTWDEFGGSWADLDGTSRSHVVFSTMAGGGSAATNKIVGWDFMDQGALPLPFDTAYNTHAHLERIGIDFDEVGAPIRGYKTILGLFPEVSVSKTAPLFFQIGTARVPNVNPTWGDPKSFLPGTDYRVDFRRNARFLALRVHTDPNDELLATAADTSDFALSGYDMTISNGGGR